MSATGYNDALGIIDQYRAAIGLGAVFLHLRTELNFHRLFNAAIENYSIERVTERQCAALAAAGLAGAAVPG